MGSEEIYNKILFISLLFMSLLINLNFIGGSSMCGEKFRSWENLGFQRSFKSFFEGFFFGILIENGLSSKKMSRMNLRKLHEYSQNINSQIYGAESQFQEVSEKFFLNFLQERVKSNDYLRRKKFFK